MKAPLDPGWSDGAFCVKVVMSKPIWFPFYPADFLTSNRVALMTTEEIGGYTLLLCYAWQDPTCTLPADDESIRKLSRLTGSLEAVKSCFIQKRGRLLNERLYREWVKVKEKSDLAKKSNAVRWQNERNANALRTQSSSHRNIGTEEQKNNGTKEESESQSEIRNQKKINTSCDMPSAVAEFEAFWTAYPRKVGRKAAQKAFQNARNRPRIDDLLSAIGRAKDSEQWRKEGGQFIPHPSTWLNQGRWDDEPIVLVKPVVSLPKAMQKVASAPRDEKAFVPPPDELMDRLNRIGKGM